MRGRTNFCPKSNCQRAHCRWAPPFQVTERSFTSQQVAAIQLRLSTPPRMQWRQQFPSETAPGESRARSQRLEALHCKRRIKRRLRRRSQIAQRIASDQSRRWPLGHCSCNRRKIISSTRGRHNPPVAKRGVIHRRDSDIAPATRAIGDPLPRCCLLADMPARLCPVRGE